MVKRLVFITEEQSKVSFLQGLLPRLPAIEGIPCEFQAAEGYPDIRRLVRAITRDWRDPNMRFIVLCDQDSQNCEERKAALLEQVAPHRRPHTLVRVVCQELESWYLGDRTSVEELNLKISEQSDFLFVSSHPDEVPSPAELITKATKRRKRQLAQAIGPVVDFDSNRSHSLQVFLTGIERLLAS